MPFHELAHLRGHRGLGTNGSGYLPKFEKESEGINYRHSLAISKNRWFEFPLRRIYVSCSSR